MAGIPPSKCTSFKVKSLLDFDFGAGGSELLFDLVGFFLGSAFLDSLGGAFDEFLRFLQAEARDLADDLDDGDLVGADIGEDDVEFGLFFRGGGTA